MMKKLVEETTWSRVYQDTQGMRMYESKLEADGIHLSLPFVESQWKKWGQAERFDLSRALSRKRNFTDDDEAILQYLIKNGDDVIASTVANAISRIRDMSAAIDLLLERMISCKEPRGNFYHALSRFEGPRVRQILLSEHSRLKRAMTARQGALEVIIDYLSCSAALAKLTNDDQYVALIKEYETSNIDNVRSFAKSLLVPY